MKRMRRVSVLAVAGAAVPVLLYAFSTGPPPGRTGAPGESTCRACHDGGSGGGKVEIGFPGQMAYAPGVKQVLSVTVTDADAQRYGFELSVRIAADNSQAGTLSPAADESGIRVICGNSSVRPAGGCPASAPIEYIEHSAPRAANTFQIEWTPPANDVGPVKMYVAANAANGNGAPTGDDIYTASYTLTPQAGQGPTFTSSAIVNAASFTPGISPGSFLSIFGENLSQQTRSWDGAIQGSTLPTQIEGVSVTVGGQPGFLHYISPGQLNVLVPGGAPAGAVEVKVTNALGSASATTNIAGYAPGFFPSSLDRKYVAATHAGNVPIANVGQAPGVISRPAEPGETIELWATGFGPTAEPVPDGQVLSKPYPLADPAGLRVSIGGRDAVVAFAGVTLAGVDQINATVPPDLADGDHVVFAEIGGARTQDNLFLPVQQPSQSAQIRVAFRLDPWLIGSTYTGGIWVSPPVLGPTTQGATFTIQARASALDAQGQPMSISPDWTPSDSGMVTVSPSQGPEVTITIQRAGQSSIQLSAAGLTKQLAINAVLQNNALLVEIAQ